MTGKIYRVTIAEKIKAYRSAKNLSMKEFGALLGVSAQAVCKWEGNLCCPDITLLPNLAKIFGVTVDDFFEDAGNGD